MLYAVVRDHLETFLAHARESYEAPLPHYVEQELRGYLRCGIFAHGFVRAHCDTCGHDLLVAFSCKVRAVCPSCAGRRMANVAAHLVDRVLPAVPVRQWVLSLPFELRALAAFRADVLSALGRAFIEAVFARYRSWAKQEGIGDAPTGAVTHVQRFGSSVNLNVHFHSMLLDGVFTRDEKGRLRFHPAPPPTREELDEVVRRVHRRALAWLARSKLLDASSIGDISQERSPRTPLDACAAIAMQRGAVRALRDDPDAVHDRDSVEAAPRDEGAVELDGFNLHASVAIAGGDDLGRERLMRYGARPPLALDRLRRLPDGRIAYRIKKLRDGRAKHRVMTPLEFLARIAAIVPPPRYPLLRYAGVLGPRSSWRRDVVPLAPQSRSCGQEPEENEHNTERRPSAESRAERSPTGTIDAGATTAGAKPAHADVPVPLRPADTLVDAQATGGWRLLTPNVISVKHWSRLLGGALYAASPRVDWATLVRRSFEVDVLACPSCDGRLRVLGEVTDAATVRLVLDSLGMPTHAPRVARARDPTQFFGEQGDA